MPALASKLDPRSAAFAANAARMQQRLDEVRALEAKVVAESASLPFDGFHRAVTPDALK